MTLGSPALAEYLRARRSQLDPESFGFQDDGRRVPGLRREELAGLAGISRDYYTRLEQGRNHEVSHQVLASLADALNLDAAERRYFHRIARPGSGSATRRSEPTPVGDAVLGLLRSWSTVPAYLADSNLDIVAITEMTDILIPSIERYGDNLARAAFAKIDEDHVQHMALGAVQALRFYGDPHNARFQEIVGELSTTNVVFRRLWARFDVGPFESGTMHLSVLGSELIEFPWQMLEVPGGFFLTVWTGAKGTRAEEMLTRIRENHLTGRPIRGPLEGWPAR